MQNEEYPPVFLHSSFCILHLGAMKMATILTNLPTPMTEVATPTALVLPPLEQTGRGSVALLELARISFASLLANKVRSLLTMLGVIIGVASVIALLALGSGASNAIT